MATQKQRRAARRNVKRAQAGVQSGPSGGIRVSRLLGFPQAQGRLSDQLQCFARSCFVRQHLRENAALNIRGGRHA